MKPLSSDDQKAALGNVRRIPTQVDMFTGELVTKTPKRGNGSHITLKPLGIERPAIPGMASWAGGGPEGKCCKDCAHLGAVVIERPNSEIERTSVACLRYCQRVGRPPATRVDITLHSACDQFSAEPSPKAWLVDWAGKTHEPDWKDSRGVGRFHHLNEREDPDNPGVMLAKRRP